ncbi:hypothetical protein E0Z06_10295 [Rheinheimera sp. D18]|uniref:WbqC family protein n=1 Tax=Rheinheimera sp. D18 TaxID=2545632 RepID=UPI0010499369|nr:WbqC family protein [Rheinheimera sp. D18]QBL09886.1 hypothetical protein E0Z06_10295 [Rheinheimera sp. D18]
MAGSTKSVVITQPMLFPWVGLLEQIKLADIVVFYDDVQFSKGSFVNRVQLKMSDTPQWLTVPLKKFKLGTPINMVEPSSHMDWREHHKILITESLGTSLHFEHALSLIENVCNDTQLMTISDIAKKSMLSVIEYFGLSEGKKFIDIDALDISGSGSERVLDIVKKLGADNYITGHGASNYLNHHAFENEGIQVRYMNYMCEPYPQLYGAFTPYVTSLDLVANVGAEGRRFICSKTKCWRDFLNE